MTRTPAQQNLEKIGKNPKPRTKHFFAKGPKVENPYPSKTRNLEVPKLVWGPKMK